MSDDRDRLNHDENRDEIYELVNIWGWWQMVDYLQSVSHQCFYDEEFDEALEELSEIALQANERIEAKIAESRSEQLTVKREKKRVKVKARKRK